MKYRNIGPIVVREVPASGAGFFKSDWRNPRWSVEQKETSKKSISIKLDYLEKISREAEDSGTMPAFFFRFLTPRGPEEWICFRPDDLIGVGGEWNE